MNGWSPGELAALLALAVLALLGLRYNQAVSRVFSTWHTPWPPGGLIREDRPEKIAEAREQRRLEAATARWGAIALCLMVLGACVYGLVAGPG